MTDSLTSNPKAELTTTTVVSLPVDEYSRLVEDADKNFGAWVDTNKRWAKTFEENRRLRALVQRAHTIIGIREAAHETHKGKAWLEQATRELNGEPASAVETFGWQPIETAPKDGRTLLLGYFNSHGKWRSLHGQWFEQAEMDEWTSDDEGNPAGWYEISVENDDPPNCWSSEPTHWQPTPRPPLKASGD